MLDAREYTAPVTTVEGFVNDSIDLDVDALPADDFVVDAAEQIEQPALFEDVRTRRRRRTGEIFVVATPCFRFVHRSPRNCRALYSQNRCLRNSFSGVEPGENKIDFPALARGEHYLVLIVRAEGKLSV